MLSKKLIILGYGFGDEYLNELIFNNYKEDRVIFLTKNDKNNTFLKERFSDKFSNVFIDEKVNEPKALENNNKTLGIFIKNYEDVFEILNSLK